MCTVVDCTETYPHRAISRDVLYAGGAANPYISVEVGDEKRRTAVELRTVDPVWDEEIMVFSETAIRNVGHTRALSNTEATRG